MAYRTKPQDSNIAYEQRNISIDSKKRGGASTSLSNFRHAFPLPRDHDFDRVTCLAAEIPKAYYMLDTNATFELNEATGSVDTTVTIAGGQNYTGADLAALCREAAVHAMQNNANKITSSDFVVGLKKIKPSITNEVDQWYNTIKESISNVVPKKSDKVFYG